MTKHVKPAPGAPLADAEAAFTTAEAELSAARGAVQAILDTQAGVMTDRRWLDLNRPAIQRNPDDPSLNEKQRAEVRTRNAYDAAVSAEGRALGLRERARKNLEDLQDAARIASMGDGRGALREAITACNEAERLHRLNTKAHERAESAVSETYGAESKAERALENAKAQAPSRIAAEFRGEVVEPSMSVEQAEAALAGVRQKRIDIRAARDALATEAARTGARAEWARQAVKAAAAHVVKVSPTTHALLDAYAKAESQMATLRFAVDVLRREGALPDGSRSGSSAEPDRFLGHQWSAAIEGLRSDHDAVLPEVK